MRKSEGKKTKEVKHKRLLEKLIKSKSDFTIKITSKSVVIIKDGFKHSFHPREMPNYALALINSIKKNPVFLDPRVPIERTAIRYFDFYIRKTGNFKNVVEIDINSAYWILAKKMGYLTEEQYNRGLDLEKIDRLAVLGSIARIQYIFEYEKGEAVSVSRNVNDNGRIAFFNICNELGKIMSEIVNETGRDYFFFFWVDAFFCSKYVAEAVIKKIHERGLECKTKELTAIQVKKENDLFKFWTVEKGSKLRKSQNIIIKPFVFEENQDTGHIDEKIINLSKQL